MKKLTKLCIGLTGLVGAIAPVVFATSCCLNRKQESEPEQGGFINVPDTFGIHVVTDYTRSGAFTLPSEGEPMYILDGGSRVNIKDKIDDGSYAFKYEFINTSVSTDTDPEMHENMITAEFSADSKTDFVIKGGITTDDAAFYDHLHYLINATGKFTIKIIKTTDGSVVYSSKQIDLTFDN